MAANSYFKPVNERGAWLGFGNLFSNENHRWWGRRRWWVQALMWVLILDGLVAGMLFLLPGMSTDGGPLMTRQDVIANGIEAFFGIAGVALAIGVILVSQDAVISERQNGVAEWLLSKPVSRSAYYLSKLAANLLAVLALMIALPSAVAYGLINLSGGTLAAGAFLKAVGITAITVIFYLTLSLMLGVVLQSRPAVLGITFGVLFGGQLLLNFIRELVYVGPFALSNIAIATVNGLSLPTEMSVPVLVTSLWCLIFTAIGLWRVNRLEI